MQCVELQNGGSTLGKKFWQGYTENSVSYKGKGSYSVLLCKQSISTIVLISRTVILIQLLVVAMVHLVGVAVLQESWWIGLPRVPGYPTGTRVINYPGNFLLPAATRVPEHTQITANVLNISAIFNNIT